VTDFPKFKNDDEMAEWFETNNVSATELETDHDVVISSNLSITLYGDLQSVVATVAGSSSSASTAPGADRNRRLVPAVS
jgi:hypothetical protein